MLVVAPVSLAVGTIVTFETTGSLDTESSRDYTTSQTANSDLSDNTGDVPDNWENLEEPAISTVTNAWNASEYLTVTRTDNGDNIENGIWYQSLTISSTRDGISSATASYEYRCIDNENIASAVVRVQLCNGTDNTTLLVDNITAEESASWTAIENDVSSVINATGTYTLYLRAEISAVNTYGEGASAIVGFDDASLTVQTYGMGYTENVVADVEGQANTGFSLGSLLPLIIAAVALITIIVVGFYGLYHSAGVRR